MDAKSTTNWDLYLALVADVEAQAHDYVPDELTRKIAGTDPSKYLTVNGNIIHPLQKSPGFVVQSVHHNSALTNSEFPINLSNVKDGSIVQVSLVYPFKNFPGREMADEVDALDFLVHPGRVIDIPQGELETLLKNARTAFAEKLSEFEIKLEHDKTYLRFFLY